MRYEHTQGRPHTADRQIIAEAKAPDRVHAACRCAMRSLEEAERRRWHQLHALGVAYRSIEDAGRGSGLRLISRHHRRHVERRGCYAGLEMPA